MRTILTSLIACLFCSNVALFAQRPMATHPAANGIRLTYLGNAGWEITDGRTIVLVDPFISQFAFARSAAAPGPNDIISPDTAGIDARIRHADYILITHGHPDHMLDAPYIARRTGAVIVGHETAANLARAYEVPDSNLITVRGGEDFEFGRFSLKVIPNIHTALNQKRYYGSPLAGNAPRGLKAPLRTADFVEGGNLAYLLRIAGYQVLIMGSMNYIEREMQGLRPDVALVGANGVRYQIFDYTGRLLRALGQPALVMATHADAPDSSRRALIAENARAFESEVKAASPNTRVVMPTWFEPIVLPERRHYSNADLQVVERAIELLSRAGAWQPRDDGGPCPPDANQFTVRCALRYALKEVTGSPSIVGRRVIWEILRAASERQGAGLVQPNTVILYNNRPGASAADMTAVLNEVRARVRTNLQVRPPT